MISVKNIFTVLVALLLSGILVTASFSGGNSEAYLFPRIISSIMMFLAILLLIFHFNKKHIQDQKINIANQYSLQTARFYKHLKKNHHSNISKN